MSFTGDQVSGHYNQCFEERAGHVFYLSHGSTSMKLVKKNAGFSICQCKKASVISFPVTAKGRMSSSVADICIIFYFIIIIILFFIIFIFFIIIIFFLLLLFFFFFGGGGVLWLCIPVNNFSVMSGRFPELNQYLSNEAEVFCSRTQHRAHGEIRTRQRPCEPALYQLS